jgi:predicted membrane channel-forming protein YqfA (hemolysin III family)
MSDTTRWICGAVVCVFGLIALFLASRATDDVMYYTGLMIFLASVLFNFILVKRFYDHKEGD